MAQISGFFFLKVWEHNHETIFLLKHKNAGEYISVLAYEFKPMSFAQQAKRALVTVLLELARIYGLDLNVNRLSPDKDETRTQPTRSAIPGVIFFFLKVWERNPEKSTSVCRKFLGNLEFVFGDPLTP